MEAELRSLRRPSGEFSAKIVRFLIGNPLIMKEMAKHVPDAGSERRRERPLSVPACAGSDDVATLGEIAQHAGCGFILSASNTRKKKEAPVGTSGRRS